MSSKKHKRHRPLRLIWLGCIIYAVGGSAAWTVQAVWPMRKLDEAHMVATVQRDDIEDAVLASGTLQAFELVNVGSQVTGEVKVLHVGLGDRVRKGQLIAEIDSSTQQNALKQAVAQETAAQAQLRAKQSVLNQNLLTLRRQQSMQKHGATARESYEAAAAAVAVTRAEIEALRAHLDEMRVALDMARVNLGYTKIQSPMDGVVVAVVTRQGQTLNASVSAPVIVKVAQVDKMKIRAEISEADVVRVSPGQAASFTILGEADRKRTAVLKGIDLAPESVQSDTAAGSAGNTSTFGSAVYYSGLLETPNDDGKLRVGMTVQVRIVLGSARQVLVVPSAALRHKGADGRRSIAVLGRSGSVVEQWVTVGLDNRTHAQVMDGLSEGDRVVVGVPPVEPPVRDAGGGFAN